MDVKKDLNIILNQLDATTCLQTDAKLLLYFNLDSNRVQELKREDIRS